LVRLEACPDWQIIHLIICHDIEFASIDQVMNETIPALQKLERQGESAQNRR